MKRILLGFILFLIALTSNAGEMQFNKSSGNTTGGDTFTSNNTYTDDVAEFFGTGSDVKFMWDTNSTADDIFVIQFGESNGANIPIAIISDASYSPNGDTTFDNITLPTVVFLGDAGDPTTEYGWIQYDDANDAFIFNLVNTGVAVETYDFLNQANGATGGFYFGGTNPSASAAFVEIARNANSNSSSERVALKSSNWTYGLSDGATLATLRANWFAAPTLNGVAAGGTETFTDAATVYIDAAPSGSNSTITRANALWVDAGAVRFDGDLVVGGSTATAETLSNAGFTVNGDDLFVAGMFGVEGAIYTDGALDVVGNVTTAGTVTSSNTGNIGWVIVDSTDNTACSSICTSAAVIGFNITAGNITGLPLGPDDAAADVCVCAGAS